MVDYLQSGRAILIVRVLRHLNTTRFVGITNAYPGHALSTMTRVHLLIGTSQRGGGFLDPKRARVKRANLCHKHSKGRRRNNMNTQIVGARRAAYSRE